MTDTIHMSKHVRQLLVCAAFTIAMACAVAVAMQPATMAADQIDITVQVESMTTLDSTACATGVAGRTDFGTLLPGTKSVTTSDCTIDFGATNSSAKLYLTQSDREGGAMWGGASDGSPDTSFGGGDGVYPHSLVAVSHEQFFDAAIQPDMKVVAVGKLNNGEEQYSISRFKPDGSLDASFGTGGNIFVDVEDNEQATAVAVEADGHILVAGHADAAAVYPTIVARLTPAGVLDASWASSGVATNDFFPGVQEEPLDMLLQPDGKIIIVGVAGAIGPGADAFVARLLPTGAPDPAFGVSGVRAIDVNGGLDVAWRVDLQPDGRILIVGQAHETVHGLDDVFGARLTTAGALDASFSGDGIVIFDAAVTGDTMDKGMSIAQQPDGKILLGGSTRFMSPVDDALFMVRVAANGTLDPTFGTAGRFIQDQSTMHENAVDLDVLPDGTIAVAGSRQTSQNGAQAWRLTKDGALDTRFSGDGYAAILTPGYSDVNVREQVVNADGSVFLVGYLSNGSDHDYVVARFDSQSIPSYTAGDWTAETPMFGACLRDGTGVTATWGESAGLSCTSSDASSWHGIEASVGAPAEVARIADGAIEGTVALRFGMQVADNQRTGALVAPVTFSVVGPA
ncbi:MAG: hypothetical protein JWM25_1884 [Thermoleophilia bacterium]|nr:hypothetical protein [Thermoleophilia bacterium]